jgi:hypothetical protein
MAWRIMLLSSQLRVSDLTIPLTFFVHGTSNM